MASRDVNVTCPCCKSRLEVDVRSGKVVKWSREQELDATGKPVVREEDWNQAAERVQGRLSSASDKFEGQLERERRRESELDELFRKANEKLRDKEE